MPQVEIGDAQEHLEELIQAAVQGADVIITTKARQRVRLVPLEPSDPPHKRQFGSAKGQIRMADDFDDPLEDFHRS